MGPLERPTGPLRWAGEEWRRDAECDFKLAHLYIDAVNSTPVSRRFLRPVRRDRTRRAGHSGGVLWRPTGAGCPCRPDCPAASPSPPRERVDRFAVVAARRTDGSTVTKPGRGVCYAGPDGRPGSAAGPVDYRGPRRLTEEAGDTRFGETGRPRAGDGGRRARRTRDPRTRTRETDRQRHEHLCVHPRVVPPTANPH